MNQKSSLNQDKQSPRALYDDENALYQLTEQIVNWLPKLPREYIVVCIGTDRSTGDSLGPLIGSLLSSKKPRHLTVYGSLHQPVHALNLANYIDFIHENHRQPFIIAVDACLGKKSSVGQLIAGVGPLKPGAALNKALPEVGDVHVTGVVNTGGFMDHAVLQSTRLSVVVDMAEKIVDILDTIDQRLAPSFVRPAILKSYIEEKKLI